MYIYIYVYCSVYIKNTNKKLNKRDTTIKSQKHLSVYHINSNLHVLTVRLINQNYYYCIYTHFVVKYILKICLSLKNKHLH